MKVYTIAKEDIQGQTVTNLWAWIFKDEEKAQIQCEWFEKKYKGIYRYSVVGIDVLE